jgi:hypothetical protein
VSRPLSSRQQNQTRKSRDVMPLRQIISSWPTPQDPLFLLDLNSSTVAIGGAGKDHKVATRGLVLAAY